MIENQILDSEFNKNKKKPMNLVVLAIGLIGIGGLIGATTNLVNGNLSEEYFRRIMGWEFNGIWKAAVFQGILEGFNYGLIFSFIFTIGFGMITKLKADWVFVRKLLKKMILVIYGCWIIGGIIAIVLAFIFPEEYNRLIYSVPKETMPRIGYAWVGGSIWGGLIGGIISLIWGLIKTNQAWSKELLIEKKAAENNA